MATEDVKTEITTRAATTMSMRWIENGDGSFAVEVLVTGLSSQPQAEAAMAHMQRLFCAGEISVN